MKHWTVNCQSEMQLASRRLWNRGERIPTWHTQTYELLKPNRRCWTELTESNRFEAWKCDAWLLPNVPLLSHHHPLLDDPFPLVHMCALYLFYNVEMSVCLYNEINRSDIMLGPLYCTWDCVSEVNACERGLCVRVWRWAPDGWMGKIYGWTVAL